MNTNVPLLEFGDLSRNFLFLICWKFFNQQITGKEYSKADSRYAGRNAAVVGFEGPTAVFVGPACLLAV